MTLSNPSQICNKTNSLVRGFVFFATDGRDGIRRERSEGKRNVTERYIISCSHRRSAMATSKKEQ